MTECNKKNDCYINVIDKSLCGMLKMLQNYFNTTDIVCEGFTRNIIWEEERVRHPKEGERQCKGGIER